MGNACSGTINFTNNLPDALTRNDYSLSDGKWSDEPVTSLAPAYNGLAAKAISQDCEMYGPEGQIQYGDPYGTKFIIQFSVPYGNADNRLQCTADGSRASRYLITVDKFDTSGKTVSGRVTIAPNP